MTWKERIDKAVASWNGEVSFSRDVMDELPLEIRLDRVFKDAGVRDLIVENQQLGMLLTETKQEAFEREITYTAENVRLKDRLAELEESPDSDPTLGEENEYPY